MTQSTEPADQPAVDKVNIAAKFQQIDDHWHPRIAARVNNHHVKLVRLHGEFVWHQHAHEDEMFLVVAGRLRMCLRDREITLEPGEFIVIPRGVEHKPVADEECQVLLFEPEGTLNTGDAAGDSRTVAEPEWI